MAVTESIRNLDLPSVTDKDVTLDLEKVVTTESEGDERYILSATPGTTTLGDGGATIDPLLTEFAKAGYVRSSGFKNAPFNITASNNQLQISVDGSSFQTISLATGNGLTMEDVSDDMQQKINLLAAEGGALEGNLAVLNAIVSVENNKFVIISGSLSKTFTGPERSSVAILPGATNDASATLGFDIITSSEDISSKLVIESQLTGDVYSPSGVGDVVPLDDVTGFTTGQAMTVSNGSSRAYFVVTSISGNALITHSGSIPSATFSGGSVVQNVFERDADSSLASPYESVDDITRALLRSIAGQIDFTV